MIEAFLLNYVLYIFAFASSLNAKLFMSCSKSSDVFVFLQSVGVVLHIRGYLKTFNPFSRYELQ